MTQRAPRPPADARGLDIQNGIATASSYAFQIESFKYFPSSYLQKKYVWALQLQNTPRTF